jgi:DeoR family transcriptional regulator, fructose operon transcriptional repressor
LFSQERCMKIVEMLQGKTSIKVNELAEFFNVSESTIRRDLKEMEENGLLSRTHGGAVGINNTRFEPTYREKEDAKHDEKEKIGKFAATIIEDGSTIILDSGTTTLEVAKNITAKNITVLTNSIDIAYILSEKDDIEVIVTGGSLRQTTRAMVGSITEKILSQFRVDMAFIGANGISLSDGITTPNMIEAQSKRMMIDISHKVVILADSTKFNNVCFSVISPIKRISSIITSSDLDEMTKKEFEDAGVEIMISR